MIETTNNDVMAAVRFDAVPYEAILTPKQYDYYRAYFREGKTLANISLMYGVDISTVCRVIKNARRRIIEYYQK